MSDTLRVNPGSLGQIQTMINGFVRAMDDELDSVRSACAPLKDGTAFGGSAAQAYISSEKIFSEAALEIAQVLNRLGAAVDGTGQSIHDVDKQAAGWFD